MKYLLAVDYDNTLFQNGEIGDKTLKGIEKFRKDGNLFGIVSGRDYVTGYKTFKDENLFDFDFLLLKTGAMACDGNGKIIYEDTVKGNMAWGDKTLISAVLDRAFELGGRFATTSVGKDRRYYYKDYPDGLDREYRKAYPHSELSKIGNTGLVSVICDNEEQATVITKKLKDEFGSVLNPLQNTIAIDISPAGVDKATGIAKYAEFMRIPFENIYVAGDNYNDLAMLEKYHSCAMTNGVDAAKAVSECVCDTVGDYIEFIMNLSKYHK